MFEMIVWQLLPTRVRRYVRRKYQNRVKARVHALPVLTESDFSDILVNDLGLGTGDVVFVHSSADRLSLAFPFYRILTLVRQVVGEQGTMLFPTYPSLSSYDYLRSGEVFDVRRTPSYTGILTEFARRQRNAIRSLHPTLSVCAIGPHASELTSTHQDSPFPYDSCSPYYKIINYDGKIIGLGVSTRNLSFVHCVDDALKDEFPVDPYRKKLFEARCVNYNGEVEIVRTYDHNRTRMVFSVPWFICKYVPDDICKDMTIHGMDFFRADARRLFDHMVSLARKNITIYPRVFHKRRRFIWNWL